MLTNAESNSEPAIQVLDELLFSEVCHRSPKTLCTGRAERNRTSALNTEMLAGSLQTELDAMPEAAVRSGQSKTKIKKSQRQKEKERIRRTLLALWRLREENAALKFRLTVALRWIEEHKSPRFSAFEARGK